VSTWDDLNAAARFVARRAGTRPRIAMVLGSGLGALSDSVDDPITVPYADIPNFPRSTAPGHAGKLVIGALADQPVMLFSGRAHLYEGYAPADIVFGVRLARLLGAESLIITNAAGGVNLNFTPGTLMLITDHINLTGANPLVGENDPRLGVRFPDMSFAYDPDLRALALVIAGQAGLDLAPGVYLGLLGPNYETPAEIRMARLLGADAVGMSTVLEVIAANHVGLRVLGISCISNMAAGVLSQRLTEEEVLETTARVRQQFSDLITGIVAAYQQLPGRNQ
jgi:purine-nucleoside phosphorylase